MKNILKKSKKGFTIIELVIVIGVIAILSAIMIPTFVNLTDKANKAALQSNLSNAYSSYASIAIDPDEGEDLVSVGKMEAYLSTAATAAAADDGHYYICGTDGVWVEHEGAYEPSVTGATFRSVFTGDEANAPSFGEYYVYYELKPAA